MDYEIRKKFGLTLSVKFWIHQSVIQNMHHSKKAFWIHQSVTEICIPDSKICNLKKKSIPDPLISNRIRLPDSAIQKSIIYAKIASRTPPHPEKKIFSSGLLNP